MAKVFRYHPGGDLSHWQISSPYNKNVIDFIQDPDGLKPNKEITSIPSPFARIDLVRTAFKHVADSKQLEGNTIFHKMISDSLDVAQVFFNYEKYAENIRIIKWDKSEDLNNLLNSSNSAHRNLGETLKLYLTTDRDQKDVYNFRDLQRIYLINYNNGPKSINIIGGTSPSTLFFSNANPLDYVDLQEGNDHFFDKDFCSLNKREPEFIKYIFGIKENLPNFTEKFEILNEYLELTYQNLELSLRKEIDSNCSTWYSNLSNLNLNGIGNLEINGSLLKTKKTNPEEILSKSGFVIQPTINKSSTLPLILPNETFNESLIYTSAIWNYNNKAPYWTDETLENRVLPFDGTKYPYLTISDLLEPKLIRTPFPINSEFFFDAKNIDNNNNDNNENTKLKGYLLPIKPLYFDYFNIEDLKKKTNDGKPFFELIPEKNGGAITAFLRIPIQDNKYIEFKRIYFSPPERDSYHTVFKANEEKNEGEIIENVFTIALYPFLKYPSNVHADYRVGIYEGDYLPITEQNDYNLDFYDDKNEKLILEDKYSQKRFKSELNFSNKTYILKSNFNYIRLNNDFGSGVIYPLFKSYNSIEQFSFAIDFGTTNTHIEYSKDNQKPIPFDITGEFDDNQLVKLNDLDNLDLMININSQYLKTINNYLNEDFITRQIKPNSEFSFPIRTSALYHGKLNFEDTIKSFADISIPLTYEKRSFDRAYKFKTNLKWAANNDNVNKKILKAYFEKLLLLIKSKVIQQNGDIDKLNITWFYPSSMSEYKFNAIEKLWLESVSTIFNDNVEIKAVCESLAPFYYYMKYENKNSKLKPVISIDLGGGTTDIVVFKDDIAKLLTSFRFAGNSIFGDEYNRNISINGFVNKYFEKYISILNDKGLRDSVDALNQIKETNNSNDLINAIFSLSNNRLVKNKGVDISFINDLKEDEDFKIIFMIFYASIQYHIAKLMFKHGINEAPGLIIYSGTASKLINIIDSSKNKTICSKITTEIFKYLYKNEDISNILIEISDTPKEITSKGGVNMNEKHIIKPEQILKTYITEKFNLEKPIYSHIDNEVIKDVLNEYLEFLDFFFNLNSKINFRETFGINPTITENAKRFLISNAKNALVTGLGIKEDEIGDDFKSEKVQETLFFYPIIGSIGELAYKLQTKTFDFYE